MFNRSQIKEKLSKFKCLCVCKQCNSEYICNPYDALKSKVGHLCLECKKQFSNIKEITKDNLEPLLYYNKVTGNVHLKNDSLAGLKDSIIGYNHSSGYISVSINNKEYLLHRIIWLLEKGYWPNQIDHINHNRKDNSWNNLREVGSRENQLNMSLRKNNTSGKQGIRILPSKKYSAYIMVNKKQISLGSYIKLEDAISARKKAEILYGFHNNHGNKGQE